MSIKNFAFALGATAVFGLIQNADCMEKGSFNKETGISRTYSEHLNKQMTNSTVPGVTLEDKGEIEKPNKLRFKDNSDDSYGRAVSAPYSKAAKEVAKFMLLCNNDSPKPESSKPESSNKSFSEIWDEEQEKSKREKSTNPNSSGPVVFPEEEDSEERDDDFLNRTVIISAPRENDDAQYEYDYGEEEEEWID